MPIGDSLRKRRQAAALQSALRAQKSERRPLLILSGLRCLVLLAAAILLPVLLTGCDKKGQEGEKKTVQKSEDDFLDKDAKPDEQKYLLAAKPFFIAVASRKYADAYVLFSSHADSQQNQSYAYNNTAGGNNALVRNITGNFNTANGSFALAFNDAGNNNTAIGRNALGLSTTGNDNTAIGDSALANNTIGSGNTALSVLAGTAITTADNTICIGTAGVNVSNSCFIGQVYSNVQPIVATDPDSVTITSAGRLGRGNVSSRRYKHDIKPMDIASEALYALKPVSFRYHKEYDATQTLAFGLIAEDVAEVYPDLVGRNPQGEAESVRYEQINAMLLNEFLKEHRKNEEREATIALLQTTDAK